MTSDAQPQTCGGAHQTVLTSVMRTRTVPGISSAVKRGAAGNVDPHKTRPAIMGAGPIALAQRCTMGIHARYVGGCQFISLQNVDS